MNLSCRFCTYLGSVRFTPKRKAYRNKDRPLLKMYFISRVALHFSNRFRTPVNLQMANGKKESKKVMEAKSASLPLPLVENIPL